MNEVRDRAVRILLTEDNQADVYLIRQALSQKFDRFELQVLSNGEEAVKMIDSLGQGGLLPDIVLLDLNLPRCDGKEILGKLRQMPGGDVIPVIIITSSDSPRDRDDVARLGATRYFKKPFELSDFMRIGDVVEDILRDTSVAAKDTY
ncbi:MAG TPA: response regulator [Bryobacteraceae bacterium]|nr:response regulator [Bryobacteraceae bacterium]